MHIRNIVFLGSFLLSSIIQTSYAQNTIDGVTAASGSRGLQIKGGTAYSDSAEIIWWDFYANGDVHELLWGTSESYGNKKDLKPFTRQKDVTTVITGLTPDTKYYAAFHRTYPQKGKDVTTKFEFTTAAGEAPNTSPEITSAPTVACTTGVTTEYTITATDEDEDDVTFTLGSAKPSWVTFASPKLTISPESGSASDSVTIYASDGNDGADTLVLKIDVTQVTEVRGSIPSQNTFSLQIGSAKFSLPQSVRTEDMTVTIFSLNGAKILTRVIKSGSSTLHLPEGFVPGMYLVQVRSSLATQVQQLNISN